MCFRDRKSPTQMHIYYLKIHNICGRLLPTQTQWLLWWHVDPHKCDLVSARDVGFCVGHVSHTKAIWGFVAFKIPPQPFARVFFCVSLNFAANGSLHGLFYSLGMDFPLVNSIHSENTVGDIIYPHLHIVPRYFRRTLNFLRM